jgi:hypothetical protein
MAKKEENNPEEEENTTSQTQEKNKFYVTSDTFKSMEISGVNGSKITFDENGKAEVTEADYKRLSTMKEFKPVK